VPLSETIVATFETESNYSSLAHRIVAAVPGGSGFILVTGDPPASPQLLSQALSKATKPRYPIIGIVWEPGLTQAQLMSAASLLTAQPKGDETTVVSASSERPAPLVVVDDVDRLSRALNQPIFTPRKELGIPGDPEPPCQLSYVAPVITLPTIRGRIEVQGPPAPASPLFVFGKVHRLSQQQLRTIYGAITHPNWMGAVAVLLAPSDFLSRLEGPGLDFLKEHLFAQFLFQEISQHTVDKFLRHRLEKKWLRHRVACAAQSRLIWGLAGCAVLLTAGGAATFLEHPLKIGGDPSGLAATKNSSTRELSVSFLTPSSGPAAVPSSELPPAPPPRSVEMPQATPHTVPGTPAQLKPPRLTQGILPPATPSFSEPLATSQKAPPAHSPTSIEPVTGVRLSPIEIASLKARGDEFLNAGDITSARLFYQRAADGGDGSSAWRLGATLDPTFLSRAGIRGISGELDRALWWYQRARELDAAALQPLVGSVEPKPLVEPATLPEVQHGVEPECIAGAAPVSQVCNSIDGTPTPPRRP
jgi:hypothetical protein